MSHGLSTVILGHWTRLRYGYRLALLERHYVGAAFITCIYMMRELAQASLTEVSMPRFHR